MYSGFAQAGLCFKLSHSIAAILETRSILPVCRLYFHPRRLSRPFSSPVSRTPLFGLSHRRSRVRHTAEPHHPHLVYSSNASRSLASSSNRLRSTLARRNYALAACCVWGVVGGTLQMGARFVDVMMALLSVAASSFAGSADGVAPKWGRWWMRGRV